MATFYEQEIAFFDSHLSAWLATDEGKWVVIKHDAPIGFFDTPEEAYREGLRSLQTQEFLMRQVLRHPKAVSLPPLMTKVSSGPA